MFVFSARQFLSEMRICGANWLGFCEKALEQAEIDLDFIRLEKEYFSQCENISVDFALMEKTHNAWMVPLQAGWSDLGSWESLWEATDKDDNGNAIFGDAFVKDCSDSLIHSEKRLIAAIGLDKIVVVDSDDALLVVNREDTQNVKFAVDWLKKRNRSEFLHHRRVYRPWGSYDSLDSGNRFEVKRIEIKPRESISLQKHLHRAEHWIVVEGTALVQKGEEELLLVENESIYIPAGEKHRLHNPGEKILYVIEVRSGSTIDEDDIQRF